MLNLEKALCIANDGRGSPRIAGNSYSPYSIPLRGGQFNMIPVCEMKKQTSVIFSPKQISGQTFAWSNDAKADPRLSMSQPTQTSRRQIVCYFNLNASRAIRDVSLKRLELPPQSETRDEAILSYGGSRGTTCRDDHPTVSAEDVRRNRLKVRPRTDRKCVVP